MSTLEALLLKNQMVEPAPQENPAQENPDAPSPKTFTDPVTGEQVSKK